MRIHFRARFSKPKRWSKLSLRTKIVLMCSGLAVLSVAAVGSLALSSITGVGDYALESQTSLGKQAVTDSTNALEQQAEEHLLGLAEDQAAISNALFEKIEAETNTMAMFASTLWSNPSSYEGHRSYSPEEKPDDVHTASVYTLAPGVTADAIKEELSLSSNMDDIFIPIYANDPNLTWAYMGMESGIMRVYPWNSEIPPSYDPRTRGWYQRAVETGEPGWTELYVDAAGRGLMVTCFKLVHNAEGELIGVAASDVTLEAMNERIINTQVGELGYALLIDNNGKIIARPGLYAGDKRWDETFEGENLLHSENPEVRAIAERMVAGDSGIAKYKFVGGEKYIAYAPIASTNWSIGIVMPVEEIIAPALAIESKISSATEYTSKGIDQKISDTQRILFGIFIAILVAVNGLAFWLARTITKPILSLTAGAKAIGRGELDYRVEVKTGDEIKELADSFNNMALDLKKYIADLRQTTAEKERVQKELEIASGIQQSFLPERAPEIEGFDIAAFNLPAREVGGDFYDFIPISANKWGLVIADVSGKGVPAALFMALSRTLVRASVTGNATPSEAIKRADNLIAEDDRSSMFVTLFYGVLDSGKKTLTYVNAGHNPPLMLRRGNITLLEAKGIALGVMPDIELEQKEITLQESDIVALYTDGVTEAINNKEEQFGQQRLISTIEENRNLPALELIKRIQQKVTEFSQGQPQFDDITLMILKVI